MTIKDTAIAGQMKYIRKSSKTLAQPIWLSGKKANLERLEVESSVHNALLEYMRSSEQRLKGGIIIEEHELWKYSDYEIENTDNTAQWKTFFPDECT